MAKRLINILFFGLLYCGVLEAQQDPMFTQYMFNMQSVNPGYTGSRNTLMATFISRWQWVGINGAPTTQTLTVQSPVPNTRFGVGLSLTKDKIGPMNQYIPYVDIAYHLPLSKDSKLSLGLKGGVSIYQSDLNGLLSDDKDKTAGTAGNSLLLPNLGFGLYFYRPRFYAGLSSPKVLKVDLSDVNLSSSSQQYRHYFGILGFVVDISQHVKFKPSILTKFVESSPFQADITSSFLLYDKLWLGATYRLRDGMAAIIQLDVTEKLRLGYGYDYPFTKLNEGIDNITRSTHEVMLSYEFKFKRVAYKNPRFF